MPATTQEGVNATVALARYRALFDNSPHCVHEVDLKGCVCSINPTGMTWANTRQPAEIIGTPPVPKHQIETGKLRALGMEFGGLSRLERTIDQMLEAQGLSERGILPGDVVYIYTGWSDHYQDPDVDKIYYSMAPGLSYDAAKHLGERRVVGVGLDTWGLDAIAEGQLAGQAPPPEGTPGGMAFPVHHHFLTQAGVHTLENIKLDELARDGVQTACTIILPARIKGAAGAPIRPVAVGVPGR